MVKSCKVPGCNSKYNKRAESNVSFFSEPKSCEERLAWSGALQCALEAKSFVCERHFPPDKIITNLSIRAANGKVLFKREYERKRLKEGATPTNVDLHENEDSYNHPHVDFNMDDKENKIVVPGQEVQNMYCKKPGEKSQRMFGATSENQNFATQTIQCESNFLKRKSLSIDASDQNDRVELGSKVLKFNDCQSITSKDTSIFESIVDDSTTPNETLPEPTSKLHAPLTEAQSNQDEVLFETSLTNEEGVGALLEPIPENSYVSLKKTLLDDVNGDYRHILPSNQWGMFKLDRTLVFACLEMVNCEEQSGNKVPRMIKEVILEDEIVIRFIARRIKLTCLSKPTTLAELQHILKKVDTYKMCIGGCSTENFKTSRPECAKRDGNCWRHKKCSLILDRGTVCKYCVNVSSLLSLWVDRNRSQPKKGRSRLQTTLTTNKKMDAMRNKTRALQRQLVRRNLQIELSKTSLGMRKKNTVQFQEQVETEAARNKIDKNQVNFLCNRFFHN